jgi:hypothetical protein
MSDEVADVLAESREYIEKNGWWKGGIIGPNGRQVCAIGGILYSQGHTYVQEGLLDTDPLLMKAIARMARVTEQASPTFSTAAMVASWNDENKRRKQDVLDAFAKAEKIERAGFDPDA